MTSPMMHLRVDASWSANNPVCYTHTHQTRALKNKITHGAKHSQLALSAQPSLAQATTADSLGRVKSLTAHRGPACLQRWPPVAAGASAPPRTSPVAAQQQQDDDVAAS